MAGVKTLVLVISLAAASAFPAEDPVISKIDNTGPRYDYLEDDAGQLHLVDNWIKLSDYKNMARYDPDRTNQYHLFTWSNAFVSQPLVLNNENTVLNSNFRYGRPVIVLMHGFAGSTTSGFNTVLVPAFLNSGDVNVIVLDWGAGAYWGLNSIEAGQAAGRFFNWLNSVTGTTADMYHVIGYSVGGHGAGIIARTINGNVGYVTGLDPADRWDDNWLFRPTDGVYTEAIHTSTMGVRIPVAQCDFFPNGGSGQPGCSTALCDHYRSYHFLGESLTRGGFTGQRCQNLEEALNQRCTGSGTLRMGGTEPKTGNTGIFHLTTNAFAPFSRG